ncbi:hypothetical protein [Thiolapillus sp.]|uniref:hypothetical protein n=1 Tax=Thiolapillus sp. TaxID=2017437 RepID=UPI003AF7A339
MTRTAGAPIGCQRPSRFWGLGCPKIYHEAEDTLVHSLPYQVRFIPTVKFRCCGMVVSDAGPHISFLAITKMSAYAPGCKIIGITTACCYVLRLDAVLLQRLQMRSVELHVADIIGAVTVSHPLPWLTALLFCYGQHDVGRYFILALPAMESEAKAGSPQ